MRGVELGGVLAVERQGGGLDAVGPPAEVDGVEVQLEDLVLRQAALHLVCHPGLLDLPAERALLTEIVELDVLLGDGRSPLDPVAGEEVRQGSPHEGAKVQCLVLVEIAILGCQHRLLQRGRHLGERDRLAVDRSVEVGEQAAVRGEDVAGLGRGPHDRGGLAVRGRKPRNDFFPWAEPDH